MVNWYLLRQRPLYRRVQPRRRGRRRRLRDGTGHRRGGAGGRGDELGVAGLVVVVVVVSLLVEGVGEGDDAIGLPAVGARQLVGHAARPPVGDEVGDRHRGGRGEHVPEHGHLRLELEPHQQEDVVACSVLARCFLFPLRRRRRGLGLGEVEPQGRVPLGVLAAGTVGGRLHAVGTAVSVRILGGRRRRGDRDGRVEARRVERQRRPDAAARHPGDVDRRWLRSPAQTLHCSLLTDCQHERSAKNRSRPELGRRRAELA